jgi:ribosomal protein S18 acetylase RimI-like enzyme
VVEVRAARAADEEALAAIDRATWSSLSSPAPPPGEEWTFFGERTSPEQVLVALVDGSVAGYAKLRHPTPLPASEHVLSITGLAVDPAKQGRGVGRALVDGAIAEAHRRGIRRVTLRVLGPNERARHLYESAGFGVEGLLRGEFFLDGAYVDDVCMALELER